MKKKKYTEKELAYIDRLMAGGMDRIRAEWYLNAMQTWTKEDYEEYTRFHLEMLGFEDEEQKKKMQESLALFLYGSKGSKKDKQEP